MLSVSYRNREMFRLFIMEFRCSLTITGFAKVVAASLFPSLLKPNLSVLVDCSFDAWDGSKEGIVSGWLAEHLDEPPNNETLLALHCETY